MTVQSNGIFITLEGIEGVGKSTCLKFISHYLGLHNIPHRVTREPGGTPFAESIRKLLLNPHEAENIHPDTELLLLFASRAQHIAKVILPALEKGEWVICDRFTDASFAYQGGGRGIPEKRIAALEEWVQKSFQPDLTILLDAPVKIALARTFTRQQQDRIEQEQERFFHQVRKTYLQRAALFPARYRVINAARPLSTVKRMLTDILDPLMPGREEKHHANSA